MAIIKYEQSGLNRKILKAVSEMGYEDMTPIQAQAVPVLLEGKDMIGQAQTGTGKTAAFGIPILQNIDPQNKNVQAIILCPTRELAIQAAEELRKFAKFLHGIKILAIYGGQDIRQQIRGLKSGVQIVVGTPGRVMDHMRRHTLKMQDIRTVILDEADEMLNMGFREDMETILKEVPQEHQTALFSATMPKEILEITDAFQKKDAVMLKMPAKELTVSQITQYYLVCRPQDKEEVLRRLKELHGLNRSLIFCNTKKGVDELTARLKDMGFQAEGLHGDLNQKQRDFVMKRFRSGKLEFLIATDVAARGIDVDDLEAVFNYDVPQDIEYYVHRIGRTGRAGKEGLSFTLISGREIGKIRDIERVCHTKINRYELPKAEKLTETRVREALAEAAELLEKEDLSALTEIFARELENQKYSLTQIAAALMRMKIGETAKDLPEERIHDPRRNRMERYSQERPSQGRSGRGNNGGRHSSPRPQKQHSKGGRNGFSGYSMGHTRIRVRRGQ